MQFIYNFCSRPSRFIFDILDKYFICLNFDTFLRFLYSQDIDLLWRIGNAIYSISFTSLIMEVALFVKENLIYVSNILWDIFHL